MFSAVNLIVRIADVRATLVADELIAPCIGARVFDVRSIFVGILFLENHVKKTFAPVISYLPAFSREYRRYLER